jgi:hypothetical protein
VAATARTVMVHTDGTRTASAPWPDASRRAIEGALGNAGTVPAGDSAHPA